jgi:hypothetical protein
MPEHPDFDSTQATLAHIEYVRHYLDQVQKNLIERARVHDQSKISEIEKEAFDRMTPLLADAEYGSPEYYGFLAKMKPALEHHYAQNSHHPEHYPDGIRGMCLLDLIEMLADWKASSHRNKSCDLQKSLQIQKERFGISDDLTQILENTLKKMDW